MNVDWRRNFLYLFLVLIIVISREKLYELNYMLVRKNKLNIYLMIIVCIV